MWLLCAQVQPFALLHLLVAGVFAMVAMGALYQFVPAVGMVRLRLASLAAVHLVLAVCGTAALVFGFQTGRFDVVTAGGAAHAAGALIEATVLYVTVRGAPIAFPARFAALALTWFVATAISGTVIGAEVWRGSLPQALLHADPVLGLAGFYGTIITAVSFRLLRMSERINEEGRTPVRVAAVVVAAALALVAAVLAYDVFGVARRRNPAYQRETLWYSIVSFLGALGAGIAAVVGYLQRIVPFLWWIQRARTSGAKSIPALKDLNYSPLGYAILALWIAAGVLWFFTQSTAADAVALAAWCGLTVQLGRAFLLQK